MRIRQSNRTRRGATASGYALVVGLISIVALGAITGAGGQVNGLFTSVGGTLDDVVEENVSFPEPSASASASASASPVIVDTNCTTLFDSGQTSDGEYMIDPDGSGGNAPFAVFCDMTRNGGGWTLVASYKSGTSNRTANQIDFNSPTSETMTGKLSDVRVNAIQSSMSNPIYRGDRISLPNCQVYAMPAASWDATRPCTGTSSCHWPIRDTYSTNPSDYVFDSHSNGSSFNFDAKDTSSATTGGNFTYTTNGDSNHRIWTTSGCGGYSGNINPPDVRFWIRDGN